MSEQSGGRRRAFNRVRRNIEGQRLALQLLVQRLESSIAAGEWLIQPADIRAEYERAREILGS